MGWQEFKSTWKDCERCELHHTRNKIVLAKGTIPCDVLFIGEAPGKNENVLGKPFIGPAGHLLERYIQRSELDTFDRAYTNLISCIPLDVDGNKVSQPHKDHINACSDRLLEFINLAEPRAIVCVGKLSNTWFNKLIDFEGIQIEIVHPAAILRANPDQQGLKEQETLVRLDDLRIELLRQEELV